MAFELKHETGPHNQRRYKLYHPTFGLNEARMVFDSISISQFLSQSQKNSLISQLEGFLSHSEVQQLKQRVRVRLIIPGLFEPPVRTLRATIPENESHIFR